MERWENIAAWVVLTVLSAILYRMGGAGKEGQWYEEALDTKWRDIGVPLCVLGVVILLGNFHWTAIVSSVLMFGAMCTYWKPKGEDAKWYNWFITGLMYAVAWLPYCNYTHNYIGFAIYSIIISIGTMAWSELNDDAVWEECGRGAIVTLFAPLLSVNLFG